MNLTKASTPHIPNKKKTEIENSQSQMPRSAALTLTSTRTARTTDNIIRESISSTQSKTKSQGIPKIKCKKKRLNFLYLCIYYNSINQKNKNKKLQTKSSQLKKPKMQFKIISFNRSYSIPRITHKSMSRSIQYNPKINKIDRSPAKNIKFIDPSQVLHNKPNNPDPYH